MNILLFGANGQLGTKLNTLLARKGTVRAVGHAELDLRDLTRLRALIQGTNPELIVNAAAYTAVDAAETDAESAQLVNAEAPRVMAEAAREHQALLVHYSTDYVFDGTAHRPYTEESPVSPLGVYGASKLAGEDAIRASGARHLILRTAWVYAMHGQNFLRTMLRVGAERDELRVVADQVGSPTPAWLIADLTATILHKGIDQSGVSNLVTAGQTSWHGFAEAIFDQAFTVGLVERKPRVVPITTAEYPTPAQRPAYSVLDVSRLQAEYGVEMPDWRQALHDTLAAHAS